MGCQWVFSGFSMVPLPETLVLDHLLEPMGSLLGFQWFIHTVKADSWLYFSISGCKIIQKQQKLTLKYQKQHLRPHLFHV